MRSLGDIKLEFGGNDVHLKNCERVDVKTQILRTAIFYKTDRNTLSFIALAVVAYDPESEDIWSDWQETECDELFSGTFFFCGLRHLYMGDDGNGYLYRKEPKDIAATLIAIDAIGKKIRNSG